MTHLYEVHKQAKLIYYDELRRMVACEKDGDWLERYIKAFLEVRMMYQLNWDVCYLSLSKLIKLYT